jgi:hypothetical protein
MDFPEATAKPNATQLNAIQHKFRNETHSWRCEAPRQHRSGSGR